MIAEEVSKLIEDSDAAEKAKKLGLKYAGWGTWVDKSGKLGGKTVKGKFVPIKQNKTVDKSPNDAERGKQYDRDTRAWNFEIRKKIVPIIKSAKSTDGKKLIKSASASGLRMFTQKGTYIEYNGGDPPDPPGWYVSNFKTGGKVQKWIHATTNLKKDGRLNVTGSLKQVLDFVSRKGL